MNRLYIVKQIPSDGGVANAEFIFDDPEKAKAFAEKAYKNMGGAFHYFVEPQEEVSDG